MGDYCGRHHSSTVIGNIQGVPKKVSFKTPCSSTVVGIMVLLLYASQFYCSRHYSSTVASIKVLML